MKSTGRYQNRSEQDIRDQLTLIGDRRDLIAHAVDVVPGNFERNAVKREDAEEILTFIKDLAAAIDAETEQQIDAMGQGT